jgi:hypothetical protein
MREYDIVVVGGCGHVGLPLAIAFADAGQKVISYDIDPMVVESVQSGKMPFEEPGAQVRLESTLAQGTFAASSDPGVVAAAEHVIVVIGTPVDAHLNPDLEAVPRALAELLPYPAKSRSSSCAAPSIPVSPDGWRSKSKVTASIWTWRSALSASPRDGRSTSCTACPKSCRADGPLR